MGAVKQAQLKRIESIAADYAEGTLTYPEAYHKLTYDEHQDRAYTREALTTIRNPDENPASPLHPFYAGTLDNNKTKMDMSATHDLNGLIATLRTDTHECVMRLKFVNGQHQLYAYILSPDGTRQVLYHGALT